MWASTSGSFGATRDYGALSAGTDLALMQEIRPLWPTFISEGQALCAACSAQRGVAVDAEVYGARLERLTAYQRLTKPSGMRIGAIWASQAGGRFIAALQLGRRSSEFRPAELERLREFAAFIRCQAEQTSPPMLSSNVARPRCGPASLEFP
jgi:hypothetical protein